VGLRFGCKWGIMYGSKHLNAQLDTFSYIYFCNPTKVTLEQNMDEDQLLDIFGRFKQVVELYSDVESIEENFLPHQLLNLLNLTAQNEQSR
jgi:uncharacterized protein YktA (UPF0223 family)